VTAAVSASTRARATARRAPPGQAGLTLIELVIAITVIGVAVAGILTLSSFGTARSADPLLRAQSHAVARSYLEEILLREFSDPDGAEGGETRPTFDDVDDYDALAANGCTSTSAACPALGDCACNQFGMPVDDLADYDVTVEVAPTILNGAAALRVQVDVSHPRLSESGIELVGYRTSY